MAIDVETKDCTALSDAELAEMADLCAEGPIQLRGRAPLEAGRGVGADHPGRENGKLQGFSFCTLERIGGTPCVLIGSRRRSSARPSATRC